MFDPEPNYDGRAWFEYAVSDGIHGSATARVDVMVTPNNKPPRAFEDHFITREDTPIIVSIDDLLANDLDPDGDAFFFVQIEKSGRNGNAFLRPDGSYDLAPRGDYSGDVVFTYTISDGRLTSEQTGNIVIAVSPVNDTPVATDDLGYATNVDQTIAIPLTLLVENDRDVDGDPMTVTRVLESDQRSCRNRR